MANLSLREAVKHFEVSRPTLQKALTSGIVSGVRGPKGHWEVDPSELARVYRPRQSEKNSTYHGKLSVENTEPSGEIERLRSQLAEAERRTAVAEAIAEERAGHIEDLRRMLPAPADSLAPSSNTTRRTWWRRKKKTFDSG